MEPNYKVDPNLNQGSPIGPGFVVYERAAGLLGYDLEMALASVGPGWAPIVEKLFQELAPHYPEVFVIQLKNKFGLLRVYLGGPKKNETFFLDLVTQAEQASATIKEQRR